MATGFDVGSVYAKVELDISNVKKGISDVESTFSNFTSKLSSLGGSITNLGKNLAGLSLTVGAPLAVFLKNSSEEASNFEKAMISLDIIAGRFGQNADDAKEAAKTLGKELRIGTGAAAESLQNLIKSGLTLEQSSDLLRRFTNEAITGKSSSISLAQAVQNLSFAYTTGNSALGNLSGMSENFSDITEKGKAALVAEGVALKDITDEMAKYKGVIDLTNLTMGSAEKFHGGLIDKQAELDQKMADLRISFGNLINPYITQLIDFLSKLVSFFVNLTDEQKKTIIVIGGLIAILSPLLIGLGLVVSAISSVITIVGTLGTALTFLSANPIVLLIGAIILLATLIYTNWEQIKAAFEIGKNYLTDQMNAIKEMLRNVGNSILDYLTSPFRNAWNSIKDIMSKIKDAIDFTKRHSPSVLDIVQGGVDKVNNALSKLDFSSELNPQVTANNVSSNLTSPTIASVTIDLSGAVISDEYGAQRIGEIMGDSIIKKLQANVRF